MLPRKYFGEKIKGWDLEVENYQKTGSSMKGWVGRPLLTGTDVHGKRVRVSPVLSGEKEVSTKDF